MRWAVVPREEEGGDVGIDGHVSQSEGFPRQELSTGLQSEAKFREPDVSANNVHSYNVTIHSCRLCGAAHNLQLCIVTRCRRLFAYQRLFVYLFGCVCVHKITYDWLRSAATHQISFPQLELHREGLFVSLEGRVIPLLLWHVVVVEQSVSFKVYANKIKSHGRQYSQADTRCRCKPQKNDASTFGKRLRNTFLGPKQSHSNLINFQPNDCWVCCKRLSYHLQSLHVTSQSQLKREDTVTLNCALVCDKLRSPGNWKVQPASDVMSGIKTHRPENNLYLVCKGNLDPHVNTVTCSSVWTRFVCKKAAIAFDFVKVVFSLVCWMTYQFSGRM